MPAVHETAEEEIVHPAVREAEGGEPAVAARVAEERKAECMRAKDVHQGGHCHRPIFHWPTR
jgi:hypothetical protein